MGEGTLAIVDTPAGERLRLLIDRPAPGLSATVTIARPTGPERLPLAALSPGRWESRIAPAEPHEFSAELSLSSGNRAETLTFAMTEPEHAH